MRAFCVDDAVPLNHDVVGQVTVRTVIQHIDGLNIALIVVDGIDHSLHMYIS